MDITIPTQEFIKNIRPFQLDILKDQRRWKVLVIHRRAGKTTLAVNKLIHSAHEQGNEGKIFLYICPTQRQAKDIVWKDPNMLSKYLPKELILRKNEVELTIFLKNGSQIYIRGGDEPDRLRGLNPYGVILDEYAQMKEELYEEVIKPVVSVNGGWVWFVGTPKGKNDFYKKYRLGLDNPGWQVLHLKASESGIIPKDVLMQVRDTSTEATFLQEWECLFHEGEGVVFRRIRENVKGIYAPPRPGRLYKMGVDLAKLQDWTVLTVVDRSTHELVYFDRFQQIDWNLQKARIEALARRYNMAEITMDSTGLGDPILEDLTRTGLIVKGLKFTNETKKKLIENLAILIEQNKISYPEEKVLIQELEDFSYELTPSGAVRYTAPEGEHDDCVISLALAYYQIGDRLPIPKSGYYKGNRMKPVWK